MAFGDVVSASVKIINSSSGLPAVFPNARESGGGASPWSQPEVHKLREKFRQFSATPVWNTEAAKAKAEGAFRPSKTMPLLFTAGGKTGRGVGKASFTTCLKEQAGKVLHADIKIAGVQKVRGWQQKHLLVVGVSQRP